MLSNVFNLHVMLHFDCIFLTYGACCNPTLRECDDEIHTPKVGTWESSGNS